jgi:ribonucleoside-triphosphate reductase
LNGEQHQCSVCSQETEIYSRVVGYLRPIKQWNNGKQAEYEQRKTFNIGF